MSLSICALGNAMRFFTHSPGTPLTQMFAVFFRFQSHLQALKLFLIYKERGKSYYHLDMDQISVLELVEQSILAPNCISGVFSMRESGLLRTHLETPFTQMIVIVLFPVLKGPV